VIHSAWLRSASDLGDCSTDARSGQKQENEQRRSFLFGSLARSVRFSRGTIGWLALTVVAFVVATFRARSFPYEDAALFEYVGRALVHGERLYVDIWDNKLPSIYLVNAVWQLLFGDRYGLHKVAEVAVNALSVGLFAVVLRIMSVRAWAPAICALAWTLAVATVLDAAEYYALPCILLAYALALSRKSAVGAGAALAIATSFWIPSLLLLIPLLAENDSRCTRRSLVVGFMAAVALYASAMIALSGFATITELVHSWFSYLTFTRPTERPLLVRFLAGITLSGVGILLLVFAIVVRKPKTELSALLRAVITAFNILYRKLQA
jgi:hypothetical protein